MREGVLQSERAAQSQHQLPLPEIVRVQEGKRREILSLDLHHGDIHLPIQSDQFRGHQVPVRLLPLFVAPKNLDVDAAGVPHYMSVGDDIPVGVHNDARPGGFLLRDEPRVLRFSVPQGRQCLYQDLDHSRAGGLGEIFHGCAVIGQRFRGLGDFAPSARRLVRAPITGLSCRE